jgi:3-hydroxyisobutyrate dehydrogenase
MSSRITAKAKVQKARIGFIGLGNMGLPMVTLIAAAGYPVTAFDQNAAAVRRLAATLGVETARSVAEVGDKSDIVVTMLPNGVVVSDVALGANGLGSTLNAGALIVDMSSSFPIGTQRLGEALIQLGIGLIDAPVSGGVSRAVTGDLAIMAGGEQMEVDRAISLLETMGRVYRTGPLGSGHALKALNNFVSAAGLAAACEALIVAKRFGLDDETVVQVLNMSSGRNNATEAKLRQFVLSGSFGSGFAVDLMAKDVRAAAQLARDLSVSSPLLELSTDLWDDAAAVLGSGTDHTRIYSYLKDRATTAQ